MASFQTMQLPPTPDTQAPDGSQVSVLLALAGGSMARFELAPGLTSKPVAHYSVEELWYFLGGAGDMWRREGEYEEIVKVAAGSCVSIPVGVAFQFRNTGDDPLLAVAVTMPPWPGEDEAYDVEGRWEPRLTSV